MTEARGGKRSNKKQPPLYNEVGLANHFKTAEAPMDDLSLAHSRYNCTYHIVFIPKYRRKVTQTSHLVRPSKNVENTPKIELFTMSFSAS